MLRREFGSLCWERCAMHVLTHHYDLAGAAMDGGKGWQPTVHCLDHLQRRGHRKVSTAFGRHHASRCSVCRGRKQASSQLTVSPNASYLQIHRFAHENSVAMAP